MANKNNEEAPKVVLPTPPLAFRPTPPLMLSGGGNPLARALSGGGNPLTRARVRSGGGNPLIIRHRVK